MISLLKREIGHFQFEGLQDEVQLQRFRGKMASRWEIRAASADKSTELAGPARREIIGTYAGIISAIFHARCVEVSLLDVVKSSYLYANNSTPGLVPHRCTTFHRISVAHTTQPPTQRVHPQNGEALARTPPFISIRLLAGNSAEFQQSMSKFSSSVVKTVRIFL